MKNHFLTDLMYICTPAFITCINRQFILITCLGRNTKIHFYGCIYFILSRTAVAEEHGETHLPQNLIPTIKL